MTNSFSKALSCQARQKIKILIRRKMTAATSQSAATYNELKERSNAFFRENPGAKVALVSVLLTTFFGALDTRICVNLDIDNFSIAVHL